MNVLLRFRHNLLVGGGGVGGNASGSVSVGGFGSAAGNGQDVIWAMKVFYGPLVKTDRQS